MGKAVKSRIVKTALVEWREMVFIQGDDFKELTKEKYLKLRTSIIENDFVESFKVWEAPDGILYCLDGYHRCKILDELESEGFNIPKKFSADFIECKDKKEAAYLVLVFSSLYADPTDEGLYKYLFDNEIKIGDIMQTIDLPHLNLSTFSTGYYDKEQTPEPGKEGELEVVKEHVRRTGGEIEYKIVIILKDKKKQKPLLKELETFLKGKDVKIKIDNE